MKKAKRLIALLTAGLILITGVLAGCGKNKDNDNQKTNTQETSAVTSTGDQSNENMYENGLPKGEKVTLKIAAPDQGYGTEMYDVAIDIFKDKYPNVKIELTTSPKTAEMVAPKISANDDEDMYNLVLINSGYTRSLGDSGAVEDLTSMMDMPTWDNENITLGQDIPESYRELFINNGRLELIPLDFGAIAYIYNKTMFEENGWNENPQTWGEFLDLCETIKNSSKAAPLAFGGTVNYAPWVTQMASMYAGGKEWAERFMKREKGIYSDPITLEPFKKMKILKDKGYFLKGTEALDHTQSQMEFLQGNVAIVPCGNWIENEMKNSAPDGFRYGMMLEPTNENPEDTKYISGWCQGGWMWAKKPELEKKWTKEFIRCFLGKEVQTAFVQNGGIPSSKSVMADEGVRAAAASFIKEIFELLSGNVEINLTLSLPAPKVSSSPKYGEVDNKAFWPQILAVYLGEKTPEQIGKEADAALEVAWADVGGR